MSAALGLHPLASSGVQPQQQQPLRRNLPAAAAAPPLRPTTRRLPRGTAPQTQRLGASSGARRVSCRPLQALAGGGAGSLGGSGGGGDKPRGWGSGGGGGSGGSGGGGGGGSSGGGASGGGEPAKRLTLSGGLLQGWADRVATDPEFPFKVLLEQVIGVGASVVGDMSSRPNWGLNELDFVFATLVVGSIVNFSLMYLLAPTAAGGAAAGASALARLVSGDYLASVGAPTGNMFQAGPFSLGGRLLNFGYKGVVFAVIGLAAGTVGTTLSNGLLAARQRLDPAFVPQNEPPTVLGNAACWSLHMGLSSNLRYQLLGGADTVLVRAMPMPLFRGYSAAIRGLNNIVGGMSFVTIARLFGVQKSAAPPPPPPPQQQQKQPA